MSKQERIFLHLPSYRDPELVPTIKDALKQAKYPERLVFGICRQYKESDGFDNVDEFRGDTRFKIVDMEAEFARGLPYARAVINEMLLKDEEYILQLDSHHRFVKNWDTTLIKWHNDLEKEGYKPILTGYLPHYSPLVEDEGRADVPWQQQAACFYPHGTIFIRPALLEGWEKMNKPAPSRFLSGHFCFARNQWAKEIRHDPEIYFSGEELNLTVRSFTHGYDFFHPHRLVIWHSTMREERSGMLVWDDQHKRGDDWGFYQKRAQKRIRNLLRTQTDSDVYLKNYDLGNARTIQDYERYAGVHFKTRSISKYTSANKLPPNPPAESEEQWQANLEFSNYHLVNITKDLFPDNDYEFILLAYDDENGEGVKLHRIMNDELDEFYRKGVLHYEDFFLSDTKPVKAVYWGYKKELGWDKRYEFEM